MMKEKEQKYEKFSFEMHIVKYTNESFAQIETSTLKVSSVEWQY